MPAVCVLAGTSIYQHMTPIFQELHWVPVVFQAQFEVLVIYKTLNGPGLKYLNVRLILQLLLSIMILDGPPLVGTRDRAFSNTYGTSILEFPPLGNPPGSHFGYF